MRFEGVPGPRGLDGARLAVQAYAADPLAMGPPSTAAPAPLAGLVLTRAGLDVRSYRPAPLSRRVAACVRTLRAGSETAACAALEQQPALVASALDTLLIGVSAFFRDPPVFDALRTRVIPGLASRRAAPRVLSVGCSGGAELLSVGMLLGDEGLLEGAYLLGIDCRRSAVSQAARGVFGDAQIAGVSASHRARYFERVAGGWRITARLLRQAQWVAADATRHAPAGPWDVVLCRNLAIYLDLRAADAMFERLASLLAPGGVLVVGKAERPPAHLPLRPVARGIYRKESTGA